MLAPIFCLCIPSLNVALTYTKVKAEAFVETTKSDPDPFMLDPFLPTVRLLDARLFPLSINVTSFPIAGEAGRFIVTAALIPLPDVSTKT